MIYIGVDFSFTSPSVVIKLNDIYYCYFFSSKKKHHQLKVKIDNFIFENLGYITPSDSGEEHRFATMHYVNEQLTDRIKKMNPTNDSKCIFEEYAYGSASQGFTKIVEISGIFKHSLYMMGVSFKEIPSKSIKKWFTGNGSATKYQMYSQFAQINPDVNILDILKDESDIGNLSDPIPDVVDAWAMCLMCEYDMGKSPLNIKNNIINDVLQLLTKT